MRVYQFRHVGIFAACYISLRVLQRGQNHKGWRPIGQQAFHDFFKKTGFWVEKRGFPMKEGGFCLFFERYSKAGA
ncbi:hypothetical protein [Janthinobacterium aquaticum]|uniref:hypothetical protein n=1 Tax=Janthinobacterium sp. FT58W TaxID=2654254 RepID=UPI0012641FFE|nr:hypothetical protein [Janthinobacterium sp. FT58W]KAB8042654.1 hypothetical protein GCM43_11255 [Janthinobacterium sp. FT58W]